MSPEAVKIRTEYLAKREAELKAGKRKPPRKTLPPLHVIEAALRIWGGHVQQTADYLGVSVTSLRLKVNEHPRLLAVREELIEGMVDYAENGLYQLVRDLNLGAIIYVLKTRGRNRGWIEKSTVEHEAGPGLLKTSAEIIEAMRKGAKDVEGVDAIDVEEYTWEVKPPERTLLPESLGQSEAPGDQTQD